MLRRQRARASLTDFAKSIDIPGKPVAEGDDDSDAGWLFQPVESGIAAHHLLLLQKLQQTMETPGGRCMVFMPPGSAKSTYASIVAPIWAMGRWPGYKIILTSHKSELAKKHGRRARNIVRSRKYAGLFQTGISAETSAAHEWALANGSEYMSAGVLAGVTGNRANGVIVDDPIAGREEAESELVRRKVKEAYDDDIKTRLLPNGWVFLIQTRWHEDDLAGSILPDGYEGQSGPILCRDGKVWEVISLAAECERYDDPLGRKPGEYLWTEWFPETHWQEFKRNPRTWSSLYQQRPSPAEGTFFRAEWFAQRYDRLPKTLTHYMTGDFAVTQDGGDFTELAVWAQDATGHSYPVDWWSGQGTAAEWIERLLDLVARYRPVRFIGEGGPIRRAIEPFLTQRMRDRGVFVACEWLPSSSSKEARSASFQAMCQMGRVTFPETPWAQAVIDQLLRFPAGKHDDKVDACSLFGEWCDMLLKPVEPKRPEPVDWKKPMLIRDLQSPMKEKTW